VGHLTACLITSKLEIQVSEQIDFIQLEPKRYLYVRTELKSVIRGQQKKQKGQQWHKFAVRTKGINDTVLCTINL